MKNKILRNISLAVLAIVFICFSAIPLSLYGIGNAFGQFICIYAAFLTLFLNKFIEKGYKKLMYFLVICFIVGMAWIILMLSQIFSATIEKQIPKDATVIVLGAKVKESGPSLSFRQRLDEAYEVLLENEKSYCIVTGGQGYNEPTTEADAGKKYLIEKGIDENRIFTEDKSTSTWENLEFSKKIIDENNLSSKIAIVTQNFHMKRATLQAKDQGYEFYSVSAETYKPLILSYYSREVLALTKYYILKFI